MYWHKLEHWQSWSFVGSLCLIPNTRTQSSWYLRHHVFQNWLHRISCQCSIWHWSQLLLHNFFWWQWNEWQRAICDGFQRCHCSCWTWLYLSNHLPSTNYFHCWLPMRWFFIQHHNKRSFLVPLCHLPRRYHRATNCSLHSSRVQWWLHCSTARSFNESLFLLIQWSVENEWQHAVNSRLQW